MMNMKNFFDCFFRTHNLIPPKSTFCPRLVYFTPFHRKDQPLDFLLFLCYYVAIKIIYAPFKTILMFFECVRRN